MNNTIKVQLQRRPSSAAVNRTFLFPMFNKMESIAKNENMKKNNPKAEILEDNKLSQENQKIVLQKESNAGKPINNNGYTLNPFRNQELFLANTINNPFLAILNHNSGQIISFKKEKNPSLTFTLSGYPSKNVPTNNNLNQTKLGLFTFSKNRFPNIPQRENANDPNYFVNHNKFDKKNNNNVNMALNENFFSNNNNVSCLFGSNKGPNSIINYGKENSINKSPSFMDINAFSNPFKVQNKKSIKIEDIFKNKSGACPFCHDFLFNDFKEHILSKHYEELDLKELINYSYKIISTMKKIGHELDESIKIIFERPINREMDAKFQAWSKEMSSFYELKLNEI